MSTPTPHQLADLVRELAEQLGQVVGPQRHPRVLGRTIPDAAAERMALIERAKVALSAMNTTDAEGAAVIAKARAKYCAGTDDIEIDDHPAVVAGGDGQGAWVAAWLYVAAEGEGA